MFASLPTTEDGSSGRPRGRHRIWSRSSTFAIIREGARTPVTLKGVVRLANTQWRLAAGPHWKRSLIHCRSGWLYAWLELDRITMGEASAWASAR